MGKRSKENKSSKIKKLDFIKSYYQYQLKQSSKKKNFSNQLVKYATRESKKHSYRYAQYFLNKMATKFYDKTAVNPSPSHYVNDDFSVSTNEIDNRKYRCKAMINYHDLEYIHQARVFDCGDASVAMLIKFHKKKCKELNINKGCIDEFEQNFLRRKINAFSGKTIDDILSYSSALNYMDLSKRKSTLEIEELAYFLYERGPLMATLDEIGGHFLVIKGVYNDEVILQDPWSGPNLTVSFAEFKKMWAGDIVCFLRGYSKEIEHDLEKKQQQLEQTSSKLTK